MSFIYLCFGIGAYINEIKILTGAEVITIDDDDAPDSSMVKVSFGAKLPAFPSPANQKEEKHPRIFVFSSEDPSDLLELLGGKVLPPSLDMKCSVEVRPY